MWRFQSKSSNIPKNWQPKARQVESTAINNDELFDLLEKIADAVDEISGTEVSFVEV